MGGTSGVILSIFFRACGNQLAAVDQIDGAAVLRATSAGCEAVTFYGGASESSATSIALALPTLSPTRRPSCTDASAPDCN